MGTKSSVYKMPFIDRAWKANVNVKQRHWFWWPRFNWGWIFKDYPAIEPKILEHRTSALPFDKSENCEYLTYLIVDGFWNDSW